MAALAGNSAIVQILINKGADVNAKNYINYTPLHAAAYYNKGAVIKILALTNNIDLNAQGAQDITPIMLAIQQNSTDALTELLNAGAVLDDKINPAHAPKEAGDEIIKYKQYWDIFDAIDNNDDNRAKEILKKDLNNLERETLLTTTRLYFIAITI